MIIIILILSFSLQYKNLTALFFVKCSLLTSWYTPLILFYIMYCFFDCSANILFFVTVPPPENNTLNNYISKMFLHHDSTLKRNRDYIFFWLIDDVGLSRNFIKRGWVRWMPNSVVSFKVSVFLFHLFFFFLDFAYFSAYWLT